VRPAPRGDLQDWPFVDRVHALTMAAGRAPQGLRAGAGGHSRLRGCSPRVLRLLSITGLRRVFDLAES
jgi:hypothetical protein